MDDKDKKPLKIKQIRNGIVIDHITAGRAPEVLKILNIDHNFKDSVTMAMNIPSKSKGRKDIVKVENRDLKVGEINKITIIAPKATINRIQDYRVVKKEKVSLPEKIVGIVRCPNPACISNKEREPVKAVFTIKEANPLVLACKYCEREIGIEDLY